jgi:hypothetical protein
LLIYLPIIPPIYLGFNKPHVVALTKALGALMKRDYSEADLVPSFDDEVHLCHSMSFAWRNTTHISPARDNSKAESNLITKDQFIIYSI